MLKKPITESSIAGIHNSRWADAIEEFGDKFTVPRDVSQGISDYTRALHVLHIWNRDGAKGSPIRTMFSYSLPDAVIAEVSNEYCGIQVDEDSVVDEVKTEKRADKWDAFLKWANQHHFEQFTTEQLQEQCGFSYPTTLKYVQDSPSFRKVKKGLWEVRDAKADRESGI
jgi:hypothetical protein